MILRIMEHEHVHIGKNISISEKKIDKHTAEELKNLEYSLQKSIFKWGRNFVSPQQWVGVVKLSNLTIEILPKINSTYDELLSKEILVKMINYSFGHTSKQNVSSSLENNSKNFIDAIVGIFLQELQNELRKGLIQSYTKVNKNLTKVKGRIDFNKHINKNFIDRHKFYCNYSSLSTNNVINQTLRTTLNLLQHLVKSPKNISSIKKLQAYFVEIESKNVSIHDINSIKWTKLNNRYKKIIEMCKMFLENNFLNLSTGNQNINFFLFDMNKLFEKVIYIALSKSKKTVNFQYNKQHLLEKKSNNNKMIRLIPDIVIKDNDTITIVDTKWKNTKSFIKESDAYQMSVYNTTFDSVSRVVLFYPKSLNNDKIAGEYNFINNPKQTILEIKSIDLTKILNQQRFHTYVESLIN